MKLLIFKQIPKRLVTFCSNAIGLISWKEQYWRSAVPLNFIAAINPEYENSITATYTY